ncbi:RAMP superfamily CRISPR-associated protein [Lyngbya confervoides]|uniref:RAMP superfamily CRISPR-associated protein n=1 Tax=Lyngbya confervoides BDU141951 TaxID=1574623 RepID=A0ABD4T5F8_9CYAN|nr:RAMP superfamily CRISPR-associated protein [Lyngbya confervoides]MCM1983653.1 RAMP superfamily CRISPR-associated protein [Lyngbya confervoides BDU141951]
MYKREYGILRTLAPLHVGASAGEETGNLNLIFRDQFTQTGIIPGSSLRGRFRADMRGGEGDENYWYGHHAEKGKEDATTEALVKFEYASLVWLPVFCPGQPIVWVSCPVLLKRYQQITGITATLPKPYSASSGLPGKQTGDQGKVLFFNLGFIKVKHQVDLKSWVPSGVDLDPHLLLVVDDADISTIHDMSLYRQSRVKLKDDSKQVDGGAFFNVEALPEGSVLVFPVAIKESSQGTWSPFGGNGTQRKQTSELYFGGLESIGFGRCQVVLGE